MKKISIIMAVYNCQDTVDEAIQSIIDQTYTNWELIICDDGSKDNTYNIVQAYTNNYANIKVYQNEKNKGLNYTLNKCLEYANGDYIARMDGDDISLPLRFEKEVKFLDENPEYAIVSCAMIYFDENGDWAIGNPTNYPTKEMIVKGTPFCHAPCMVRKQAYDDVQGYTVDEKLLRVEDYHLWIKMYAKGYIGYNISEPLYKMRDDRGATNRRKYKYRVNEAYVKYLAIRELKLSKKNVIYMLKPLIVGVMPKRVYEYFHRRRLK